MNEGAEREGVLGAPNDGALGALKEGIFGISIFGRSTLGTSTLGMSILGMSKVCCGGGLVSVFFFISGVLGSEKLKGVLSPMLDLYMES